MSIDAEDLRALVREVVRDAVAGLRPPPTAPDSVAAPAGPQPTGPHVANDRRRTETVRLTTDAELDGFVRTLLRLFENPKNRADLKAGRLMFRLGGTTRAGSGGAVHRIERGAVTERHVAELAGGTLVLGRGAVLTPLAREKARTLGITITKERT